MDNEFNKKVKEINADSALTSTQKSRLIQDLFNKKLNLSILNIVNDNTNINCNHYKRGCKIIAKCCNKIYPCRVCHDENENHKIDRYATEELVCNDCETRQPISNQCINCHRQFGKYFCNTCRFWNELEPNEVFHCNDCNVCRLGNKEEYKHCHTCNACIKLSIEHKCIEKVFSSQCPICTDNLFDTREPTIQLRCGHVMHQSCAIEYGKTNYQCPICKKSIIDDMSEYWAQKKACCDAYPVPEEYRKWVATIYCNDCSKEVETKYHLIDLECTSCGGFNTQLKSVDKNESSSSEDESTYESTL